MATGQTTRIALIGLTILERLGIREIAAIFPKVETKEYLTMAEVIKDERIPDAFVVDSEAYLLNPVFFMPRRQQTLVVMRHSRRGRGGDPEKRTDEALPATIYFDSDEAEIEDAILTIVKGAKKHEVSIENELSSREKEVLREVSAGKTNKEIADDLCISVNTVITHRKNITAKLGIHSVSGLSLYAVMNGIS